MFWGLIMEPQRRYTQQVKKAFHISMAALDGTASDDEPAQVMCTYEGRNYLLCTLKKPDLLQCTLDLNFDVGNEVSFATNGNSHIHLSGYLVQDDDEFGEEIEEEEEDEEEQVVVKQKKRAKPAVNGPPSKKQKGIVTSSQADEESDDSDESDDFDLGKALDAINSDEEDDTSYVEEEEGDDDDDQDGEEEESEQDDVEEEESDDEEVVEQPKQPKLNGVAKKQQKQENNITKKTEQTQPAKKKTLQGGVIVEDIKEGQGKPAKNGRFVNVYYEGRLKQNNKMFDSTKKGSGFSFRLGSGEVIKGWDVGVAGMKIGGKRRIICPPAMAYGPKGSPPAIPPNSTLVFEVELRKIS